MVSLGGLLLGRGGLQEGIWYAWSDKCCSFPGPMLRSGARDRHAPLVRLRLLSPAVQSDSSAGTATLCYTQGTRKQIIDGRPVSAH